MECADVIDSSNKLSGRWTVSGFQHTFLKSKILIGPVCQETPKLY